MKARISDKYPIMFSVMLGILLTVFIAVATTIATLLELSERGLIIAMGLAFLIMAIISTLYMKSKDRSLLSFGFQRLEINKSKKVLYYIPLLIIALVIPSIGGLNTELAGIDILIILIFTFLVGYTEESIFRGIFKERLESKGKGFFILFSSIFFGFLHIANALSGKDLTSVILQVINAFLIGLILALLITLVHNIIPLIAFHFLYDALAIMTSNIVSEKTTLALGILTVLYTLYGIYLLFVLRQQTIKSNSIKIEEI